MMKDAKKETVRKKPVGAQLQKKSGVPSNQKKPTVKREREIAECHRRQTVMKAAQKKIAQKKPADVQLQKKPVTPPNQKKAAVNTKGGIAGCYRTIAEAHIDGDYTTKRAPAMFIEFHNNNKAWLMGEVTPDQHCIGGPGRIKQMPCGEVRIYQPCGRHSDCIGTETVDRKSYGGFISAKVISPVPGTSFQAQKTDPDMDSDFNAEPEDETWLVAPPTTVVTQKGDIICTFTISSLDQMHKKPMIFVHLLRPMLPTTVAILKTKGLMWQSLGPLWKPLDPLANLVYDMMLVADDKMPQPPGPLIGGV